MFPRKSIYRNSVILLLTGVISVFSQGGLPGQYLLTQRWRELNAPYSPFTNAALLTEANYISARVAFAPVLQNAFKLWEAGITYPIGLYQSAGLTLLAEDDGEISGSIIDSTTGQLTSGGTSTTNDNFLLACTYAYNIWSRLSVGVNLNIAYQSNFGDPIEGIGLDIGLTYRLLHDGLFGTHLIGFSTQNLIAPQMSHSFIPDKSGIDSASGAYARGLKVTWLSNYWEHQIESDVNIDIQDFLASAKEFQAGNTSAIQWDLTWDIGVWFMRMFNVYLQFGFNQRVLDWWGLAAGFNVPSVNNGRDLAFIYQYLMKTEGEADRTHTLYARVDMGKHREEIYARKMARLASLSPNELYNKARQLYSEKKYWDAFFVFSRIVAEFPDFFKNDWVKYYRSSCQEELDMREMSVKDYQQVKTQYPLSAVVAYSDLGLMRIYYRNSDFVKVAEQFTELNKPNVPDSLRFHGAYLMGQTNLQNNDLPKAIQVFSIIPEEHPDYVFTQHAIAVAHAKANDDPEMIVTALENCISAKAQTQAQKEIVARSYVFLGYLFYEDNSLSKAVVALRMVPTTSFYAEDALLGQAWTALRARQWPDCIAAAQLLTKTSNKVVLECDGMLLQAYGHLLQKEYALSLDLLKTASEKIHALQPPNPDSLNFQKMQYESARTAYQFLGEKVDNISYVGYTAAMVTQTDSMHLQQLDFIKKFDDFYAYANLFQRTNFFARNINVVREDVDYALVTVQKIAGQTGAEKTQQKMEDKQKDIDSQIQKLKGEMNKMQDQKK
jgi:tetratricopeptide (TPR) repeat protein